MERLSGLDATFLYFETPTNHMHVSAVMILDTATVPGGYTFEKLKAAIGARTASIPHFRRRLAVVPFNLHHPVWFDDPHFDLDYHVRRVAVPAPGGPEQLGEVAGDLASRPLDRSRPLWELWVCEGLEGGNTAIIAKMHHSTIDGVTGANLMLHLFDLEPEPSTASTRAVDAASLALGSGERKPSDMELIRYAMISRLRHPKILSALEILPRTLQAAWNVVQQARDPGRPSGAAPLTAPRTSFNAAVTSHRSVAFTPVPLSDIKAIKNAFGSTVNDVVLAICAGALRRYLIAHHELPDRPLVATCPVSVHGEDVDRGVGDNKVSAMFVSLATTEADPGARLLAIRESTRGAKEIQRAVGATFLMEWSELAAPNTFAQAARLYSGMKLANRHPVVHNVVISNVPGPNFPLYIGGARLIALNPLGPIFDGAGLNITVLSYMDQISFGFIGCRELIPDLWSLAHGVTDATEELMKASQQRVRRRARLSV